MVKFTFLPVSDSRLAPEHRAQFLTIGQFIKWELTDSSGTYSGLMIVGEQKTPRGFQTMANMTIDLGRREISPAKVQELTHVVNTEFIQRAVVSLDAGRSKVQ